jgi:hypothetical protein
MYTYYVDESGYKHDWAFALVRVEDQKIPGICLKKWRRFYRESTGRPPIMPEYKDADATDRQRSVLLKAVAEYSVDIWGVIKRGYRSHTEDYSPTVTQLLGLAEITDNDTVVVVDRVERTSKYMDRRIQEIREGLGMPNLNIRYSSSEKEKGIQIADAVAGAIRREYIAGGSSPSFFRIIAGRVVKPVIEVQ